MKIIWKSFRIFRIFYNTNNAKLILLNIKNNSLKHILHLWYYNVYNTHVHQEVTYNKGTEL